MWLVFAYQIIISCRKEKEKLVLANKVHSSHVPASELLDSSQWCKFFLAQRDPV